MRSIIPILFSFVLIACGRDGVPKDIIPPEQMEKLIWDLARADALAAVAAANDTAVDKKETSQQYYSEVFRIHNTGEAAFQKSISYYQEHPQLLKVLLDSVNEKQKRLNTLQDPSPRADSIRNVTIEAISTSADTARRNAPRRDSLRTPPVRLRPAQLQ